MVEPEAGDVRGGGGEVGEAVDVEEVAGDGEGLVGDLGGHGDAWWGGGGGDGGLLTLVRGGGEDGGGLGEVSRGCKGGEDSRGR